MPDAGLIVSIHIPSGMAEHLQNALYSQLAYAKRQYLVYAKLILEHGDLPSFTVELESLQHQVQALEEVMRQVGRHI